jgi:aminodeoxyfutalosine synthase
MSTTSLQDLGDKLAQGGVLSKDEARLFAGSTDLVSIGMVATDMRARVAGDEATFVRVAEVAVTATMPDGWPAEAGEVRLVGRPATAEAAIAKAWAVRERAGATPVTAYTLTDLVDLAGDAEGLVSLARALREAGVHSVADVALDKLSDVTLVHRVLDVGLGVQVARWSAAPADPVSSLRRLHDLQDATRAFRAFAPLSHTTRSDVVSTGYDDVRMVALARVLLPNLPHIQADWQAHGAKLSQAALLFGASDLDRVPPVDDGSLGARRSSLEEVRRNIEAASLRPAARDGRFDRVPA